LKYVTNHEQAVREALFAATREQRVSFTSLARERGDLKRQARWPAANHAHRCLPMSAENGEDED
jgi:hypothetical protein